MEKLTRRFLFGDFYNIEAYEEYFAEMSRKGLHLEKVGRIFGYFRQGEPEHLNYRIDMFKKDEKDIKIKKHREKDWELVGIREAFLVFSSKENSGLDELYQTPEEQRLALKHASKKSLASNIGEILLAIFALVTLIGVFYMEIEIRKGFFLSLVDGSVLITIWPVLIAFIGLIRQRWHTNRIMRTLKSGQYLSHYGNHFLARTIYTFRNIAFVLFIVVLFYPIYQSTRTSVFEDAIMEDLPIIKLADIETEEYAYPSGSYNSIYKTWSLFVPEGYDLGESIEINEEGGDLYEVSILSEYYLGRFDIIAKGLEGDILHREERRHKLKLNKILEEDGLICYGGEDEDKKILLARKGKQVIYIRYYGEKSLDELMKATIKKLEG